FPVLDLGIQPDWDPTTWQLEITGVVTNPVVLSWEDFRSLQHVELVADFHCVTRWSKFDVRWRGVRFSTVVDLVQPAPNAKHVIQRSADGYSTNLPLSELLDQDVLLADELDGAALSREHGAPLRTIVPARYAWKGAKFLRQLEFTVDDQPGFWEVRGYHNQGDPWKEERFAEQWWV
ncbi:MAG: molybdopterin-dependent oxidoreductase, partial [Chloroflexi bacterium]|nr:molybdopterin-dependent oxidoreductase [Chloroflexota bacterium]